MTSLITKEEFKQKLIHLIDHQDINNLSVLKEILEDKSNITDDYPSSPTKPSLDKIKSTGEKAFQRAIFNGKYSMLDFKRGKVSAEKVTWIDIELPVVLNKNPRRRCIDLIGSMDGVPVLCELKYKEKSPSDHPLYAIIEILMYRYLIHCNYEKLDKHEVHHNFYNNFRWEIIVKNRFPQILVVANKSYWDYWFNRISKDEFVQNAFELGSELDTNIHLFEAPDEDFINQKGNKESYKPTLTSNYWEKLTTG